MWTRDIIKGRSETEFAPNDLITREEAATILSRIADFTDINASEISTYIYADNAQISEWAIDAVSKMESMGIMLGMGDNTFSPKSNYTVEQAIVTILRLYNTIQN